MKKLTVLLLTAAMLLTLILASCGESTDDTSSGAVVDESKADVNSDEVSEDEKKPLVPYLDPAEGIVDGYTLKVLTCSGGDNYAFTQFVGKVDSEENTEFNEDPVNLAILDRNYKLEAEYGFKIEAEICGIDMITRVEEDYMGGIADYQVICGGAYRIAPVSTAGYLTNVYDIEDSYLNLDEKWWDSVAQKDMSIGNKLYLITGDILVSDDEFIKCIYFNKDIVEQYKADPAFKKTPYELVYDNEWTIDAMYEMIKAVAHDGGDSVMHPDGEDDMWGLVGVAFDTYMLVMGCDAPQVKKDADDIPVFAMTDEMNVNAFQKVFDIVTDTQTVAIREEYYKWDDNVGNQKLYDCFYDGRGLFFMREIEGMSSPEIRNLDFHYGILPYPKYNVEQEHYTSTINPYGFGVLGISNSIEDEEIKQVTFCLEAMAYTNYESVTSEYYIRNLKMKRLSDDDDSTEMLDLISRNRLIDMSVVFNWNDCIQYYNNLYFKNNNQVESYCQGILGAFNAAMKDTLNAFDVLEN